MAANFSLRVMIMPQMPSWMKVETNANVTFDRSYIILMVAMYSIGLIMAASSSMPVAERLFNDPFHFVIRHGIYIGLSVVIAGFALQIPMSWWHQNSGKLLLLAITLLLVVLAIGRTVNGSTRWIVLGPITIQAAEPAKLFFFCLFIGLPCSSS